MNAHEYKPGDRVIIYQHGKPVRNPAVVDVKQLKRRSKITLGDGSEWNADGSRYGGGTWDTWHMGPSTPEGLAALDMVRRQASVTWVADNWSKLTDEQRVQIGDIARAIRKAAQV